KYDAHSPAAELADDLVVRAEMRDDLLAFPLTRQLTQLAGDRQLEGVGVGIDVRIGEQERGTHDRNQGTEEKRLSNTLTPDRPKWFSPFGSSVPGAIPTELVGEKLLGASSPAGTSCRTVRLWDGATGGERRSAHHHGGEGPHVLLEQHEQADQHREREAMPEHVTEDSPLLSDPPGRGARHADALSIDHLAHYSARTVRCREQDGIHTQSLRGDALQTAEQHVRRRVAAGERHAKPSEHRGKERI